MIAAPVVVATTVVTAVVEGWPPAAAEVVATAVWLLTVDGLVVVELTDDDELHADVPTVIAPTISAMIDRRSERQRGGDVAVIR